MDVVCMLGLQNACVHSHQLEMFSSNTFSIYPQFIDIVTTNDTSLFGVDICMNHFLKPYFLMLTFHEK